MKARLLLLVPIFIGTALVLGMQPNHNRIVGTWLVTITSGDGAPTQAIDTFTKDGALIETDTVLHANSAGIMNQPFNASPGQGLWKRAGGNRFESVFQKFLFDDYGNHFGKIEIFAELIVDRGSFSGNGHSTLFDTQGNQVGEVTTFNAEGQRMRIP